jgi:hypothetical protein
MYFITFVLLLVPFVALAAVKNELILQDQAKIGEVVKTKVNYLRADQLPANFDYRTKGLLTTDLNQHIPVYW